MLPSLNTITCETLKSLPNAKPAPQAYSASCDRHNFTCGCSLRVAASSRQAAWDPPPEPLVRRGSYAKGEIPNGYGSGVPPSVPPGAAGDVCPQSQPVHWAHHGSCNSTVGQARGQGQARRLAARAVCPDPELAQGER